MTCYGAAALSLQPARGTRRGIQRTLLILCLLLLSSCMRTLVLPAPEGVPSPAGPTIDVTPVTDGRSNSRLGKVDTFAIDSGPDLVEYVNAELTNGLARMGFAVRQMDGCTPGSGHKCLQVSLLAAELSSESTLTLPVSAAVRLRVELTDEIGQLTFRRILRGAISRELGFHTQGGMEDAQLLAEVIDHAVASLAADGAFLAATAISEEEAARSPTGRKTRMDAGRAAPPSEPSTDDTAAKLSGRLSALDQLLEEGLIDEDDYLLKRREILGGL